MVDIKVMVVAVVCSKADNILTVYGVLHNSQSKAHNNRAINLQRLLRHNTKAHALIRRSRLKKQRGDTLCLIVLAHKDCDIARLIVLFMHESSYTADNIWLLISMGCHSHISTAARLTLRYLA